jgi:hypothetical protein
MCMCVQRRCNPLPEELITSTLGKTADESCERATAAADALAGVHTWVHDMVTRLQS